MPAPQRSMRAACECSSSAHVPYGAWTVQYAQQRMPPPDMRSHASWRRRVPVKGSLPVCPVGWLTRFAALSKGLHPERPDVAVHDPAACSPTELTRVICMACGCIGASPCTER